MTKRIIPIARTHERIATQGLTPADLAALRRCLIRIYENLSQFQCSGAKRLAGRK